MSLKHSQAVEMATAIIEEHFRLLRGVKGREDVLVSGRTSGRWMVEIFRLLTGSMPQAAGIEVEFHGDELPGVEFASPVERDPNDVYFVYPGKLGEPDVLVPGDQHGKEERRQLPPRSSREHRGR